MRMSLTLYDITCTVESRREDFSPLELKGLFSRMLVVQQFSPNVLISEDGEGRWEFCLNDEVVVKRETLDQKDGQDD